MSSSQAETGSGGVPPSRGAVLEVGDAVPSHFRGCFGCGPDHPTGLHLQTVVEDENTVVCAIEIQPQHQGAAGLAHGGILSTIMDEVLGCLLWLVGSPAVTGRLEVDYRKPVPVGNTLYVRAWLVGVEGRRVNARAEGRLDSADGVLAVEGAAVFIRVGLEHFHKHDPRRNGGAA